MYCTIICIVQYMLILLITICSLETTENVYMITFNFNKIKKLNYFVDTTQYISNRKKL